MAERCTTPEADPQITIEAAGEGASAQKELAELKTQLMATFGTVPEMGWAKYLEGKRRRVIRQVSKILETLDVEGNTAEVPAHLVQG